MNKLCLNKKEVSYYLLLIIILILAITAMLNFKNSITSQMLIIVVLSVAYASWGIAHHLIHHNIKLRIVLEYILIGALGVGFILFLTRTI